jgi:hypothetical protein
MCPLTFGEPMPNPNAIRDAISLSLFQLADDDESVNLVLRGWHYRDTEPLIRQLAGLVGCYADDATDGEGLEDLQVLAYAAARDPRCAT